MKTSVGLFCFVIAILFGLARSFPTQIDEPNDNEIEELGDEARIDLAQFGSMLFSEPDEQVGKAVQDWLPEHDQNPEELGSYVEGDMLIPTVEGRNGLVRESTRWPNGIVPYVFASNVGSADRNMIMRAMEQYHSNTCIKFRPRTTESDYLSFESSNTGCWSSVGKVGRKQSVNLQSPGCTTKVGTPIHEIMHALGFLHEQNRNDRDSFVRIITSNIKQDTLPNFEKARAGETNAFGVQYDTGSVMHYSSTAFSINGQKTIEALQSSANINMGQRDGFAQSDLQKINQMYCGRDSSTTTPQQPNVPVAPSAPKPINPGTEYGPGLPPPGYGYGPGLPPPGYGYGPGLPPPGYGYGPGLPPPGYGYGPGLPPPGYGYGPGLPPPGYGYGPGIPPPGYGGGQGFYPRPGYYREENETIDENEEATNEIDV